MGILVSIILCFARHTRRLTIPSQALVLTVAVGSCQSVNFVIADGKVVIAKESQMSGTWTIVGVW